MRIHILFIALLLVAGCSNNELLKEEPAKDTRLIKPAFTNFDIPFEDYIISAIKGDTIYTESGSILVFPSNSFVDRKGNIVEGDIRISYRDFIDPMDMFISGIPMSYDSSEVNYVFESSAMCEIYAFKGEDSVYVNSENKPEINLLCENDDRSHNLYFLDTKKENWLNKGKDVITDLRKSYTVDTFGNEMALIESPIKPNKASGSLQRFSIKIEPGSIEELQAYHNLEFEIVEEQSFDPKDSEIEWEYVEVDKAKQKGRYLVTFTKGERKLSMLTKAVFEGEAYDEAMKTYEIKKKEHDKLLSERIEKEENIRIENERTEKLNALIQAQNIETLSFNERINANMKEQREKNKKLREAESKRREEIKEGKRKRAIEKNIVRTFTLEGFGIWNCDRPVLEQSIPLYANFIDQSNENIPLEKITVVYKDFNGLLRFADQNIKVIPNSEMMIWSIHENKLAYMNYEDVSKYKIDSTMKECTFTLRVHPETITSKMNMQNILELN